ncbi:hypothetical protein EHV15_09780 [Paenibacillus oralis]|uniref:Uncharacterized protein n=1 Tax=Paenibacillus oralis TaxID=2490856 RepID=A0A3P3TYI7_9BACL|nr:hypothetical protein [Paenibacillus oralis]RRJ63177.1 hypothetical protein EHV15_09780 [Paenibacillus oralis]
MSSVMSREEALGLFLENHVLDRWQGDLETISETFIKNQDSIKAGFAGVMDAVCRKGAGFQDTGVKGEIQFIYLSLLRTSVKEHQADYRIDLYDERWFFDPVECSLNWQAEFIFAPLFQRMRELDQLKSSYARKVSSMDIERILQMEAERYHLVAIEFMRSMVPAVLDCEGYKLLAKKPNLCIFAGEYRDRSEVIYGQPEAGPAGIAEEP